jgi:hypothetical protein
MGWMTMHAGEFLQTFVEYPPTQPPASVTIDQIAEDVERRIRERAGTAGAKPSSTCAGVLAAREPAPR